MVSEDVVVAADDLRIQMGGLQQGLVGVRAAALRGVGDLVAFGVALAVALDHDLVPPLIAACIDGWRKELLVEADIPLGFGGSRRVLDTIAKVCVCRCAQQRDCGGDEGSYTFHWSSPVVALRLNAAESK
jgi:hypothetical protein